MLLLRAVYQYTFPTEEKFTAYCRHSFSGVERAINLPDKVYEQFVEWFYDPMKNSLFESLSDDEVSLIQTGMTTAERLTKFIWDDSEK